MAQAAKASSEEQRERARLPVELRGVIRLPNHFKFDVKVRDFSAGGAQLRTACFTVLPDRFILEVFDPGGGRIKVCDAQRCWQHSTRIGVKFLSSRIEYL